MNTIKVTPTVQIMVVGETLAEETTLEVEMTFSLERNGGHGGAMADMNLWH